jgi:hypothetical protein
MLATGAIALPAATDLLASSPLGRFTVIGSFIAACELGCLWVWWRLRPKPLDAGTRRLVNAGAVLTLAALAGLEGGLVLFLGRYPDDPLRAFLPCIAVGGAGGLSLLARIAVGIRARAARRAFSAGNRLPG